MERPHDDASLEARRTRVQQLLNDYELQAHRVFVPQQLHDMRVRINRWEVPGRTDAPREKWQALVARGVTADNLGWVPVPEGGGPALDVLVSADLGRPIKLGRNLKSWETAGLVRQHRGEARRRDQPLVAIELVLPSILIDWLVDHRLQRLQEYQTDDERAPILSQISAVLKTACERRLVPKSPMSFAEARQLQEAWGVGKARNDLAPPWTP